MKGFITIFFLLFIYPVFAQSNYPSLSFSGETIESFVPNDWKIIKKSSGDLNKDSLKDFALVIESNDANVTPNDSLPVAKKRILVVLIQNRLKSFDKVLQSNTFILSEFHDVVRDPFVDINLTDDGYLELYFDLWRDVNGTLLSNILYRFFYQYNSFELVWFNKITTNRINGDSLEQIIDFNTRKCTTISSNYLKGIELSKNTKKFELTKLRNIVELEEPFTWNICGMNL